MITAQDLALLTPTEPFKRERGVYSKRVQEWVSKTKKPFRAIDVVTALGISKAPVQVILYRMREKGKIQALSKPRQNVETWWERA